MTQTIQVDLGTIAPIKELTNGQLLNVIACGKKFEPLLSADGRRTLADCRAELLSRNKAAHKRDMEARNAREAA